MGQEIGAAAFSPADFERFRQRLTEETALLHQLEDAGTVSQRGLVAGFELEAWLVDPAMCPTPRNAEFLAFYPDSTAAPELARFNVEFNSSPLPVEADALVRMHQQLEQIWVQANRTAERIGCRLLLIGILPTLEEHMLTPASMSDLNRFRALNEQILAARGEPARLHILGHEHLRCFHSDVMLEAATTSFQLHLQVPWAQAVPYFNASLLASAPLVGISANSPFLFQRDLWAETRIPVFEQAIEIGGYRSAAHGPLRRVGFGSTYARNSLLEYFDENLEHYPALLPMAFDSAPEDFAHLRLHNGTIWRWNRPILGFDVDGTPHLRIEQRVMATAPSLVDGVANAAFYLGLVQALSHGSWEEMLPFPQARDNFYQAARHGLAAQLVWWHGAHHRLRTLVLDALLPLAQQGLHELALTATDPYLDVIARRVENECTGSEWQRCQRKAFDGDLQRLTAAYWQHQQGGQPIHLWEI